MSIVYDVELSRPQEECVNYKSNTLLVKGVAGSGKSLVIMKRALKLHSVGKGNETVKIFTYANSLVKYTKELLAKHISPEQIEVLTVDGYALKVYWAITGCAIRFPGRYCKYKYKATLLENSEYSEWVDNAVKSHKKKSGLDVPVYKRDREFWEVELRWIREKCLKSLKSYLEADRKGRGATVRLRDNDKKIIWEVYEQFEKRLKEENKTTWEDIYMFLTEEQNLQRIPDRLKINHVLIDEAQDMTCAKMKLLAALAKDDITIAADLAQKIYKTSFTWAEVGIDVKGRASKTLNQTFRCTRQIVELAEDLMIVNRANSEVSDEYTVQEMPVFEGNKPSVFKFSSIMDENAYIVGYIKSVLEKDENCVIGVICRTSAEKKHMGTVLRGKGVDFEDVDSKKENLDKWHLQKGGVKLVTCHSSKGLEFDVVLIPDFNDNVFPLDTAIKHADEDQLQNVLAVERSLLYVSMTRAKKDLALFCIRGAQSRFLKELSKEHYVETKLYDGEDEEEIPLQFLSNVANVQCLVDNIDDELTVEQLAKLVVGKPVTHTKYKKGMVVSCDERHIDVKFSDGVHSFPFPASFVRFLKMEDEFIQEKINTYNS